MSNESEQPVAIPPLGKAFPSIIDNTLRSTFTMCPQKFFRAYVQQISLRGGENIHLTAGGAFARGLEVSRRAYYEGGATITAAEQIGIEAMRVSYGDPPVQETRNGDKSLANLERAFESYMFEYPLAESRIKPLISADGKASVEFTFAIPIDVEHPETNEPILYAGRFDMFGLYNDVLFVVDEKTATQLGEQWRKQWDMDSQFTGYCWAAKQFGYPVAGAVVRGIGLLKTKITHSEAIVYRQNWFIDRWYAQLCRDIKRAISLWKEGYWDFALDKSACAAWGGCAYKPLCESPQPEAWLPNYEQHVWDPLKKY